MTSAPTIPPLTGTITVDAPIDQAFRTFTDAFGSWWPAEYHIGQADMATAILEPREGGRWYEQGTDGSECDWGRVLAWEPPTAWSSPGRSTASGSTTPTPSMPARSRSASAPTDPSRPPSSWNTDCLTGSSTARRSVTGSPVAAAGPASWSSSPRQPPTRPDQPPSVHIRAIRWPARTGQRLHRPRPSPEAAGLVRVAWRHSGCRPPESARRRWRPAPPPRWCRLGRRRSTAPRHRTGE